MPRLITKIGSETLTIYGAHYVLLYGTWFGLGLSQIIGYRSLGPVACIIGAALFVFAHIKFIQHIEPLREIWYVQVPAFLRRQQRLAIIWLKRDWPKLREQWQVQWQSWLSEAPNWLLPLVRVMSRRTKD